MSSIKRRYTIRSAKVALVVPFGLMVQPSIKVATNTDRRGRISLTCAILWKKKTISVI